MKTYILLFFVAFSLISCSNYEISEIRYEDKSIYSINKHKKGCDTVYFEYFYKNGNLRSCGSSVDSKIVGQFIEYYPDGKLKSNSYYKDGKPQLPSSDKHNVEILYGEKKDTLDKTKYSVRISVDGVSPYLYQVLLMDSTDNYIKPKKYNALLRTYRCKNSNGKIINLEVDESMYNYTIEDLESLILHGEGVDNCFLVAFFYPNSEGIYNYECPSDMKLVDVSNLDSWIIKDARFCNCK